MRCCHLTFLNICVSWAALVSQIESFAKQYWFRWLLEDGTARYMLVYVHSAGSWHGKGNEVLGLDPNSCIERLDWAKNDRVDTLIRLAWRLKIAVCVRFSQRRLTRTLWCPAFDGSSRSTLAGLSFAGSSAFCRCSFLDSRAHTLG